MGNHYCETWINIIERQVFNNDKWENNMKINGFFKKYWERFKKAIHSPVLLFLLSSIALHMITYFGTRLFTKKMEHFDMTTMLDDKIPFASWTIIIYFGCYLFWGINYAFGCLQDEEEAEKFLSADFIAKFVCLICFVVIPTTKSRPVPSDDGVFNLAMVFLYRIDAADNLFPSIHCLTSWFSVIAIRRQNDIPKAYKYFSVLFTLAICISTLTTKQHAIVDTISGVMLAEVSYQFVCRYDFVSGYKKVLVSIKDKVVRKKRKGYKYRDAA